MVTYTEVEDTLRELIDPELGMSFVDLGLIYDISIKDDAVTVFYSLTTPGCPIADTVEERIHELVIALDQVNSVEAELTWLPLWTAEMMSEDAKFAFGF